MGSGLPRTAGQGKPLQLYREERREDVIPWNLPEKGKEREGEGDEKKEEEGKKDKKQEDKDNEEIKVQKEEAKEKDEKKEAKEKGEKHKQDEKVSNCQSRKNVWSRVSLSLFLSLSRSQSPDAQEPQQMDSVPAVLSLSIYYKSPRTWVIL
jgi:hypothetical protein